MGLGDPNDLDNCKDLLYEYANEDTETEVCVRYDEVLLGILDEMAVRWNLVIETDKIWLTGFSGGAQFAERFWILWPERLHAVSVGAAGDYTSLDWAQDWPRGVRDAQTKLGRSVDVAAMGKIPVQLVVGGDDHGIEGGGVYQQLPGAEPPSEEDELGRVERMDIMVEEFSGVVADLQHDVVPGVGHDAPLVFPAVEAWLARVMGY